MGALSYMATGLAEGIGKGAASYGLDLMKQADQKELLDERQRDRLELAQMRSNAAGGGAKASLSPSQKLYEFGQMMLSGGNGAVRGALMAGGMVPEEAADASSMMQGNAPMREISLSPDRFTSADRAADAAAAGPTTAQAPKYMDGQARQLMEQSRIAMRRAFAMIDPAAADDVAKAEGTEQTNDLVRKFVGGNDKAGMGALIAQGKDIEGASGNAVTGAVKPGSVAASTVRKNDAEAGKDGEQGKKYKAEAEKIRAEIDGDLAKSVSKERLATMLNSLNTYAKDSNLSDADLADLNKLRQEITRQMRSDVSKRDAGGKPEPAGKSESGAGLPKPKTEADYKALPKGARYIAPDGKVRTKG